MSHILILQRIGHFYVKNVSDESSLFHFSFFVASIIGFIDKEQMIDEDEEIFFSVALELLK